MRGGQLLESEEPEGHCGAGGHVAAGSGDVLAGAIVGLLAQGLAPFEAAICSAYLHGLAGEIARRDIGDAGAVASDVLARLPAAIRQLR